MCPIHSIVCVQKREKGEVSGIQRSHWDKNKDISVCVCVCVCVSCSVVSNSAIQRTIACQVPLLVEFSQQEYCSGLPFPSPGHLPHPGVEPISPAPQADSTD